MSKKRLKGLADPEELKLVEKDDLLQVIVETPRGSRNKYAFDADQKTYTLKAVLPAGMSFPYDFGFLPRTKADDGDAIDVLVLMDESVFPGIVVPARLIGVITGEQIDGKKKVRNDRLIAVAGSSHVYQNIRNLKDLPEQWIRELEHFFVHYHKLQGRQYKLLGCKGAEEAKTLMHQAQRAA